jgi:hypothetical protein
MPLLGKRKYINDKIEKLINKLDLLGYDTTAIKNRYYDIEQNEQEGYISNGLCGSILPYRNKINDVLRMIEELINPREIQDDFNQIQNYDNSSIQFKNDLMERVKNDNVNTSPSSINSSSFSLGYY